jgi:hypothetical protein
MRGAIPPLPQYVFMVWCLVKHRDNFTFLPISIESVRRQNTAEINLIRHAAGYNLLDRIRNEDIQKTK